MKFKHVVFDWDGTLADTYPVIAAGYDYAFDKLAMPRISLAEIRRVTSGLPNKEISAYLFGERKEEAMAAYYDYIEKHHTEKLRLIDGALDLLRFCRDKNCDCRLFTNKKRRFVEAEMQCLQVADFFSRVVPAGEYAADKPHPAACDALFAGELTEGEPVAVIGDGETDVKTARYLAEIGYAAICILYDAKQTYQGWSAEYVVADLRDAEAILE